MKKTILSAVFVISSMLLSTSAYAATCNSNNTCPNNTCITSQCDNATCSGSTCSGSTCSSNSVKSATCSGSTCSSNSVKSATCSGSTCTTNSKAVKSATFSGSTYTLSNNLKSCLSNGTCSSKNNYILQILSTNGNKDIASIISKYSINTNTTKANTTTTKPDTSKDNTATTKPDTSKDNTATTKPDTSKDNTATTKPDTTKDNTATSVSDYESQVLSLINAERAKYNLSALSFDSKDQSAAEVRANEIVKSFSHTRPDGTTCFTALAQSGATYTKAAENIAYGQKSPQAVVDAWMNSEGHRANILTADFTKTGIGCVSVNGTLYWTQFFTK